VEDGVGVGVARESVRLADADAAEDQRTMEAIG